MPTPNLYVSENSIRPAANDADAYSVICSLRVLLNRGLQRGSWCATAGGADHALLKGADGLLKQLQKQLEEKGFDAEGY